MSVLINRAELPRPQQIDAYLMGVEFVSADLRYGMRRYGKRRWVVRDFHRDVSDVETSTCFYAASLALAMPKAEAWITTRQAVELAATKGIKR